MTARDKLGDPARPKCPLDDHSDCEHRYDDPGFISGQAFGERLARFRTQLEYLASDADVLSAAGPIAVAWLVLLDCAHNSDPMWEALDSALDAYEDDRLRRSLAIARGTSLSLLHRRADHESP